MPNIKSIPVTENELQNYEVAVPISADVAISVYLAISIDVADVADQLS